MRQFPIITLVSIIAAHFPKMLAETPNSGDTHSLHVHIVVTMPFSDVSSEYDADIYSTPSTNDTLSSCDFLIRWQADLYSPRPQEGLTAYSDKQLYIYDNNYLRLIDSISHSEVINSVKFAAFVPQILHQRMDDIVTDPTCIYLNRQDTIINGNNCHKITLRQGQDNDIWREYIYVFTIDRQSPVLYICRSNPNLANEYTTWARYSYIPHLFPNGITPKLISDFFPEIFL